jgi:hypothetical protein
MNLIETYATGSSDRPISINPKNITVIIKGSDPETVHVGLAGFNRGEYLSLKESYYDFVKKLQQLDE